MGWGAGLSGSFTREGGWKSDWREGGNFQKGQAVPSSQGGKRKHVPRPYLWQGAGGTHKGDSNWEAEYLVKEGVGN